MPDKPSPIRSTDNEARKIARDLIRYAKYGALAVLHPETGLPHVTRIAIGTTPNGAPITLISDLSFHTNGLRKKPNCSLLLVD